MNPTKLDRTQTHAVNARAGDGLHLWNSPVKLGPWNFDLKDASNDTVVTIYGLSNDQLNQLRIEIASILGIAPDATLHDLKQIHATIENLIQPPQQPESNPFEIPG